MRTIIIDDEENARASLMNMVREHCPDLEIVATGDTVQEGIKAIEQSGPELVFLDIELRTGNSFDILERLSSIDFEIIFTTAYDQYALKAIKYAALDYLLKPIDIDELCEAVKKVRLKKQRTINLENISNLLSNLKSPRLQKLTISNMDEIRYVNLSEIVRCEADGGYTHFYLVNDQKITVPKTLGDYEELLCTENFLRVHHSHLVNLAHVKKFLRAAESVLMSDGSQVQVASRKKNEVLEKLSQF